MCNFNALFIGGFLFRCRTFCIQSFEVFNYYIINIHLVLYILEWHEFIVVIFCNLTELYKTVDLSKSFI